MGKIPSGRGYREIISVLIFSCLFLGVGLGATLDSYGAISGTVTILDETPPKISEVSVAIATPGEANNRSAAISWATNEGADSAVIYWMEDWAENQTKENSTLTKEHNITLYNLAEGTYYFVVNSSDEAGNWAASGEHNFTIEAAAGGVEYLVINEIQVDGINATDEFVELYNPTDEEVNLSGWKLQYKSVAGTDWLSKVDEGLPASAKIAPHGYFLLAGKDYDDSITPDYRHSANWKLSNGAGHLKLINSSGIEIDKVGYGSTANSPEGSPAETPSTNQSIERNLPVIDTNNNSADFMVRDTPTPTNSSGIIPPVGESDVVLNEVLPTGDEYPEFIELYNRGDTEQNVDGWNISLGGAEKNVTINGSVLWAGCGLEIQPQSWTVINLSGVEEDILAANDTIILYDGAGKIVDEMSYVNATTPDKTLARIPDGFGKWIDPIPTPGAPNDEGPPLNETNETAHMNETNGTGGTTPTPNNSGEGDADSGDLETDGNGTESETVCEPIWNCTEWSECVNGTKIRICVDVNDCNTTNGIPETSEECEELEPETNTIFRNQTENQSTVNATLSNATDKQNNSTTINGTNNTKNNSSETSGGGLVQAFTNPTNNAEEPNNTEIKENNQTEEKLTDQPAQTTDEESGNNEGTEEPVGGEETTDDNNVDAGEGALEAKQEDDGAELKENPEEEEVGIIVEDFVDLGEEDEE